jgi:hypothetical protein
MSARQGTCLCLKHRKQPLRQNFVAQLHSRMTQEQVEETARLGYARGKGQRSCRHVLMHFRLLIPVMFAGWCQCGSALSGHTRARRSGAKQVCAPRLWTQYTTRNTCSAFSTIRAARRSCAAGGKARARRLSFLRITARSLREGLPVSWRSRCSSPC